MINTCNLDVNTTLPLVCIGSLFSFLCGVGIGANDLSANFAMVVGSGSLKMKSAIIYCAVFELLGAAFMGGKVSNTIRNSIVTPVLFTQNRDAVVLGMTCASFAAALWLYLSTVFGLPVSITHTVIGSIIGFAIFMTWSFDEIEARGLAIIVASWVIAPIAACAVTACIFYYMRRCIFHVRGHSFERALRALPYCLFVSLFVDLMFIVIERPPIMTQRFAHWLPIWVQFVLLFLTILAFCKLSADYVFPRVASDALEAHSFVWESSAIRTELVRRPSVEVAAEEARQMENNSFFRPEYNRWHNAPVPSTGNTTHQMTHTVHVDDTPMGITQNNTNINNNKGNVVGANRSRSISQPLTSETTGNDYNDERKINTSMPAHHDTHDRPASLAGQVDFANEMRTNTPALLATPMLSGMQTPSSSSHGRTEPAIRLTSLTTSDSRIVPQGCVHLAPVVSHSSSSSFVGSTSMPERMMMMKSGAWHNPNTPHFYTHPHHQQPQEFGRRHDIIVDDANEEVPLLGHAAPVSSSSTSLLNTATLTNNNNNNNNTSGLLPKSQSKNNINIITNANSTNNSKTKYANFSVHDRYAEHITAMHPEVNASFDHHVRVNSTDTNIQNNIISSSNRRYDSVKGSTPTHTSEQDEKDEDAAKQNVQTSTNNAAVTSSSSSSSPAGQRMAVLPGVDVLPSPSPEADVHSNVMTELVLPNARGQMHKNYDNGIDNMSAEQQRHYLPNEAKMNEIFGDEDWAMDHPMQPINFGGLLIKPFNPRAEYLFTGLQVVAGSMSSFVHGAVAGANATAAFVILYDAFSNHELNESDLSTTWSVLPAMLGIAIGMFALGASLMKTVGVELVTVTPARGWCIQVGGTFVTMILTGIGIPVSLSQSQVGAAIGCGVLDAQLRGVSWKLVGKIVVGWVITLVISAVTTGTAMWLLGSILC